MTDRERQVPSDHELEALLADTRAMLAKKARWEDDQINRDLDVLVHRVRGAKRVSYAQVLRERAQSWQGNLEPAAPPSKCEKFANQNSGLPNLVGQEEAPDKLADQLARSEELIRGKFAEDEDVDVDSTEDFLESVGSENAPDSGNNF